LANGQGLTPECQEEWQTMIAPTKPWKFVIRHTLTRAGKPELAEIDRRKFREES
jgi:hypothetical protein